jgi:hypothetical protein
MAVGEYTVYQQEVTASATLTQYRGAQITGAAVSAGGNGFIASTGGVSGDLVPLVILGVAIAETGATVTAGSLVEFDSVGRVINRSSGAIVGRAIQGAAISNFIQVIAIPN